MINPNLQEACRRSGMPISHGRCFQSVANRTNCVIASRSVGIWATSLILEGHATKGFHVKAKSCNWGPMAGFVLSDPRFTKRGTSAAAMESQRKDIHSALVKGGAGEFPVFITDERRKELESLGAMTRAGGNINEMIFRGVSPDGTAIRFVLRRDFEAPGASGKQMWAVLYDTGEKAMPGRLGSPTRGVGGALLPVMALVDPFCAKAVLGTYRSAMTGDYDLWAVFPPTSRFQARGADARPVPGSSRHNLPIREFIAHEDPHMGNITSRIREIKDQLNAEIRGRAGYPVGDLVHHSDEAGRPLLSDVELQVIAFIPGHGGAYFLDSRADLTAFFKLVVRDWYITLNPGWGKTLGFQATPRGNWEV